ncbi:hypothetical protein SUGI_1071130 [Cryptomeria japonica]|uniref:cytochrome P450 78A4 n=1 Tax=Cryptomeria japonica TaxID=3369 RepID=UPI002414A565|nr:cytochrome P450 78A4 [Cryptomeria japonica]GLJ50289.1 hypothetical protein SUGI_1071130 [Cryptomeria japonica]
MEDHSKDGGIGIGIGIGIGSSSTGGSKDPFLWLFAAIPMLTKDAYLKACSFPRMEFSVWSLYMAALAGAAAVCMVWLRRGGGVARKGKMEMKGEKRIPGPRGWPLVGSLVHMTRGLAHRNLAQLATSHGATRLMAFSMGFTPAVITGSCDVAREILNSPCFADRPLKQSAKQLMFERAIGFAPSGDYWRMLRRISATYLFSPSRIAAHGTGRQADSAVMVRRIREEWAVHGAVKLRPLLQDAALNNIMGSVFGKRFDVENASDELEELRNMVREGFELLGEFNWADHLPFLRLLDPHRIHSRCARLVPRVKKFVQNIIDEHRCRRMKGEICPSVDADFVDVLLSLKEEDKLEDDDMVAVLWEMIFRGTDTTALLTEWIMAEMVLNPEVQRKVQEELEVEGAQRTRSNGGCEWEWDVVKLPYLQAVVKETLRIHPPGPLLSWARLATQDVVIGDSWRVPAGTTAMVNMWAITHDPTIWHSPSTFMPHRFLLSEGGQNIDLRGNDLRLAPFGAGRRVCPGKALGLATVHCWVATLLYHFHWLPVASHPVDLSEVLKLSCQMAKPLVANPLPRNLS